LLALLVAGCSVDDGGTPTCMTASTDTCTGDTVCIASGCTAAFPHAYVITNLSVTAPNLKMDGNPWDADGDGTPDLYVDLYVNGTVVTTTTVNPDSFNATFAGPFTVMLDANASLDLKASDKDDPGSELVYDCPVPMVTASFLRVGYALCSGAGTTLNYTIHPAS
jgi:hypothetical protein